MCKSESSSDATHSEISVGTSGVFSSYFYDANKIKQNATKSLGVIESLVVAECSSASWSYECSSSAATFPSPIHISTKNSHVRVHTAKSPPKEAKATLSCGKDQSIDFCMFAMDKTPEPFIYTVSSPSLLPTPVYLVDASMKVAADKLFCEESTFKR